MTHRFSSFVPAGKPEAQNIQSALFVVCDTKSEKIRRRTTAHSHNQSEFAILAPSAPSFGTGEN
jgi:hypothetical protein